MLSGIKILFAVLLTREAIAEKIKQYISCADCEVKVLSIHIPFRYDISDFTSVELTPRDSKAFGRKLFTAYFSNNEGKNFIGTVFAYVDKNVMVLVAKERLPRGAIISPENFDVRWMSITLVPQDFIPAQELENEEFGKPMKLKVPVGSGEILRRTHIEENYAVKKGEKIKLVLSNGNIYLEFPAIALSNAKEGEIVKVRNLSSNKVVYGIAHEGKVVRIDNGRNSSTVTRRSELKGKEE